jgi:hypothetical protein
VQWKQNNGEHFIITSTGTSDRNFLYPKIFFSKLRTTVLSTSMQHSGLH